MRHEWRKVEGNSDEGSWLAPARILPYNVPSPAPTPPNLVPASLCVAVAIAATTATATAAAAAAAAAGVVVGKPMSRTGKSCEYHHRGAPGSDAAAVAVDLGSTLQQRRAGRSRTETMLWVYAGMVTVLSWLLIAQLSFVGSQIRF